MHFPVEPQVKEGAGCAELKQNKITLYKEGRLGETGEGTPESMLPET